MFQTPSATDPRFSEDTDDRLSEEIEARLECFSFLGLASISAGGLSCFSSRDRPAMAESTFVKGTDMMKMYWKLQIVGRRKMGGEKKRGSGGSHGCHAVFSSNCSHSGDQTQNGLVLGSLLYLYSALLYIYIYFYVRIYVYFYFSSDSLSPH